MIILGIETSCDETGIAIYNSKSNLMFNRLYSQIDLHKKYGGTVPELASRDHSNKIFNLILSVIKDAKLTLSNLSCIAYTKGPGLVGSLLVGTSLAKSISYSLGIPHVGINHLEAHININLYCNEDISYPFLTLLISGGHTYFIKKNSLYSNEIIGETIDDSVGETFDKVARILNLDYPNGMSIEKFANKIKNITITNKIHFPNIKNDCLNFSFSGIKSHMFRIIKKMELTETKQIELAYQFQKNIIEILVKKCIFAVNKTNIKTLVLAGGVASNKLLRLELLKHMKLLNIKVYFPSYKYCTDNGAMIAFDGFLKYRNNIFDKDFSINVYPKLKLN